jgi:hypothetical protein
MEDSGELLPTTNGQMVLAGWKSQVSCILRQLVLAGWKSQVSCFLAQELGLLVLVQHESVGSLSDEHGAAQAEVHLQQGAEK